MSRRREVEHQLGQLRELQEIIASMKTLSQLEMHKLGGLAENQHAMSQMLEQVAADFLRFHPRPDLGQGMALWLVVGSERGFCGDFNEALIRRLLQECPECQEQPERVLAVGRKLWIRLEEALPGFVPLAGASVSEELPATLSRIVAETHKQLSAQQVNSLRLLYHGDEQGTLHTRRLLPPELSAEVAARGAPPLLQLEPEAFFADFLQHYLYLGLTEIFTVSLLAENHHRVQHLEGAVRRLDDRLAALASRSRALRQEEITEEIEMILLGTGAFTPMGRT